MFKTIDVQTQPAQEIQIETIALVDKTTSSQPSIFWKRLQGIVCAILSALVGCLINTGWSVAVSED